MSVPGAEGQNSNKNSDELENQKAQPGNNKNDDVKTEYSQEGENDSKEPGNDDFMHYLTVEDCENLKVDDKIDFRYVLRRIKTPSLFSIFHFFILFVVTLRCV